MLFCVITAMAWWHFQCGINNILLKSENINREEIIHTAKYNTVSSAYRDEW